VTGAPHRAPSHVRVGCLPHVRLRTGRKPGSDAGRVQVGLVVLVLVTVLVGLGAWVWVQGSIGTVPIRPHCTATANGVSYQLSPEQAGNAATIAAISVKRDLPARAASIGIATAMQESKLHNIDYGDRDSLGLFQQRPSQGWGDPEEIMDPVYATNAFFDVLIKVEGYESLAITDAAQKVQKSAYPTAYADHEPEARVFASTLTGYSPAALSCVLNSPQVPEQKPNADGLTPRAETLVQAAAEETGRTGTSAAETGDRVSFALTGKDRTRLAWSLAQWAVARADALDIVAVEIDDMRWLRSRPDLDWAGTDQATASGTVVITVANG
jgi:hypothetical protein